MNKKKTRKKQQRKKNDEKKALPNALRDISREKKITSKKKKKGMKLWCVQISGKIIQT